ncbi:hypothetical protein GSY74_04350 [Sulfurovum sp. bin170]|uniref:hypothetical protein n=1 Tax=Sulfurovum sp. bin170 TaxID=2695268 RepID=UPI0013DFCA08|nr:hypothetical protein [Sulfurovum sp. bin170]NEW60506.1 hypothetical protein [Sulfurovum sp. bin170]
MKLTTDRFINKSLSMPTDYFIYSLESIIDEQISDVRELLRVESLTRVEPELMDEIASTIKQINKKVGWFSKFFHNIFGIERDIETPKRRLKALLDLLHSDTNRLAIDIKKSRDNDKKVIKILDYLQELKSKLLIIDKNNNLNKNKIFIKEIEGKIQLLKGYSIALSLREVNLLEIEKIYKIIKIEGY